MKKAKRNIIIAAVLVLVCAAVYLNWSYNRADTDADPTSLTDKDDTLGTDVQDVDDTDDYFAQARSPARTRPPPRRRTARTPAPAPNPQTPAA